MMKSCRFLFAAALAVAISLTCNARPKKDVHLERNLGGVDTSSFFNVFKDVYGQACNELHSLMVIKDGKVVYERYAMGHNADELHIMWSASKTFNAAAVGFAIQDGLLSLDDKVISFFDASELPAEISSWYKELTIKDLLIMSSGFEKDEISRACGMEDYDWAKSILSYKILWEPGTRFSYNSMNSYLLSVIVTKVTGMKVADYLKGKLFEPLGIRRYQWMESPQGYNCGGWGLHITTESLGKMCQFFLNKGAWNGKQLLDPEWIEDAMTLHILQYKDAAPEVVAQHADDEWGMGYGYQMWIGSHGHVRIDGAHGQYGIILPDKNAAIIVTSHTKEIRTLMNSIWKNVYPSL